MASIFFFASIREDLGCKELSLSLDEACTVSDLIKRLADERGEAWGVALTAKNVKVAVNQEFVTGNPRVSDGDEIAFFPPVTGG